MYFTGLPWWAVVLIIGACACFLAVLHMLRVRPRPVVLVTSLFWDMALRRTQARTLRHRFRYPLTFFFLLLICCLMALALLRPQTFFSREDRIHQVMVIDAGASMAARDSATGSTRLEAARNAAINLVSSWPGNAKIAVIVMDPYPRMVRNFNEPSPFLKFSLSDLEPVALPGLRREALEMAQSLIPHDSPSGITFISDRPWSDFLPVPELGPKTSFQYIQVGSAEDNFGLISCYFSPSPQNIFMGTLSVRIGYWGKEKSSLPVSVRRLGGAALLETTMDMAPSTTADIRVDDLNADGDRLVIQLQVVDALPEDNMFEVKLPHRTSIRVAVQDAAPSSLDAFFKACPDIRIVAPSEDHDVLFCRQADAVSGPEPAVIMMASPVITSGVQPVSLAGNSPLTKGLEFEGAFCGSGGMMDLPPQATPLLLSGEMAVAALLEPQERKILLLAEGFCGEDSPACRTGAFAIFMNRCLYYLLSREGGPISLPPERMMEEPAKFHALSQDASVMVLSGSRRLSNLADMPLKSPELSIKRSFRLEMFQWLLLAALACYLVEIFLYLRGRMA